MSSLHNSKILLIANALKSKLSDANSRMLPQVYAGDYYDGKVSMLRIVSIAGIAALALSAMCPINSAYARARHASEVHIDQARGRVPATATPAASDTAPKTAPEGATINNGAAAGSPSTPVTCNQQNASSPACYSATQSARPAGR
jgi:hypothetical protein